MEIRNIYKSLKRKVKELEGAESRNQHFSSQNDFPDEDTARKEFERAKLKLFDINKWSELPGFSSEFKLYNDRGELKSAKKPEIGDYVLIDLPTPAPSNWVKVVDIKEEENMAEFIVSPSGDPKAKGKEAKEIKHFFIDEASSTFRVKREHKSIFAYEIGKNIAINNKGEEAGDRKIVNTIIAGSGWAGLQKLQWENLTDYLVHKTEIKD
jgi:hypothetical protein